jgi:putative endonuclease
MVAFFKAKHQTGRLGESLAEKFLTAKGFSLIGKNFRIPGGEIDLIFKHDGSLVFVEVKTRRSDNFGPPEDGFNFRQKQKLLRAIYTYNQSCDYHGLWRLDLIAITIFRSNRAEIKHYKNILEN